MRVKCTVSLGRPPVRTGSHRKNNSQKNIWSIIQPGKEETMGEKIRTDLESIVDVTVRVHFPYITLEKGRSEERGRLLLSSPLASARRKRWSPAQKTIEGLPGGSVVKNLPAMQETWVRSLGQEDPLEKEMAIHSSILAWEIPGPEEPGGLQSMGLQRVGHD